MQLDELVVQIQIRAEGVEETLSQITKGIQAIAGQAEKATGAMQQMGEQGSVFDTIFGYLSKGKGAITGFTTFLIETQENLGDLQEIASNVPGAIKAVSYTHLDVYKRQV